MSNRLFTDEKTSSRLKSAAGWGRTIATWWSHHKLEANVVKYTVDLLTLQVKLYPLRLSANHLFQQISVSTVVALLSSPSVWIFYCPTYCVKISKEKREESCEDKFYRNCPWVLNIRQFYSERNGNRRIEWLVLMAHRNIVRTSTVRIQPHHDHLVRVSSNSGVSW